MGAGSVVLFLAGRAIGYQETELWGAAWAIAGLAALLGEIVRPNRRDIVATGVFTTLALLTRASVGLAPLVATGLVFVGAVFAAFAARAGQSRCTRALRAVGLPTRAPTLRHALALLVAVVIPFAAYAYVNYAKFDTPLKLPITAQLAISQDPARMRIFATTGGSLFAPKFIPTDVLAALRPDGLRWQGAFPFITFPAPADRVGGIAYAARDPQASFPASMPFLFVFSAVGLVAAFLPSPRRRLARADVDAGDLDQPGNEDTMSALAPLRVLVVGSIVGAAGVLTIPFINHRYLSDFLPLVAVTASAGLLRVLARVDDPQHRSRVNTRRAVIAVGAMLAVASLAINFALALQYQRAYSPFTSIADRAAFIRFQAALDNRLPGGSHLSVQHGDALPAPLAGGTLFVVGDCDGVYWSDGVLWRPIERTPATGEYHLRVTFPDRPAGTRETMLVGGPANAPDPLIVEYLRGGRVRFALRGFTGAPVDLPRDRTVDLDLVYDWRLPQAEAYVDGRSVFGAPVPLPHDPVDVAGFAASPRVTFSGHATPPDNAPKFCRTLPGQRVASGSNS
jgi:hypothetical protein